MSLLTTTATVTDLSFVIIGKKGIDGQVFNPIVNEFLKPTGGLWASELLTLTPNKDQVVSPWHLWCDTEMPTWLSNDAVVLKLRPSANILILDSAEKAFSIFEQFKINPFPGCTTMECLDFERLSKVYDGMMVSGSALSHRVRFLYSWDCESLLLFNLDCIESSEYHELDICVKEDSEEELKKKLDDAEQRFYAFSGFAQSLNTEAEEIFCNTMSLIHEVSEEAYHTDTPEYELNKQMISVYEEAITKLTHFSSVDKDGDSEERDLKAEEDADTEAAYHEFMDKCEREQRERIESEDEEIEQNDQKYNNDVILW